MAQRLVYNPKAWVYIKSSNGNIYDLSGYVTGGKVDRLIDAVSTAEIRLRNPNKIFTASGGNHPIFFPMDPITIFLERIDGHPVRVFTGFLDSTPYYQMFPGEVTMTASCTLKRLQYIFFNPSLPYFRSFLEQFGWLLKSDGTFVNTESYANGQGNNNETKEDRKERKIKEAAEKEESNKEKEKNYKEKSQFEKEKEIKIKKAEEESLKVFGATPEELEKYTAPNEASTTRLLWAVLYYIAQLRDEQIYVEALPPAIAETMFSLVKSFNVSANLSQEQTKEEAAYTEFFHQVLGTGSQGSANSSGGSISSGNLTEVPKIVSTMVAIAEEKHVPAAFVICTSLCECSFSQSSVNGTNEANATGWFQFTSSEPYPGVKVNYPTEARDTAKATEDFCNGVLNKIKAEGKKTLPNESEWNQFSYEKVQVAGTGGYPGWDENLKKAEEYIAKYANGPGSTEASGRQRAAAQEHQKKETGSAGGETEGGERTRIKAMEEEAEKITKAKLPYAFGGGHPEVGVESKGTEEESGGPIVTGFDCSGSVAAVLAAGGLIPRKGPVPASGGFGQYQSPDTKTGVAPQGTKPEVTVYYNSGHAWMTINGRYFSTGWNENKRGGAGWGSTDPSKWPSAEGTYESFHYEPKALKEPYNKAAPEITGSSGEGNESSEAPPLVDAKVAAFTTQLSLPTMESLAEAIILKGQKSLMNDVPLLPFVQQVAQASLRSFMSLPNGDFYAFYPDYFGEFGHHKPYWWIEDIEILNGGVQLSDENLVTHMYVIGDNSWPVANNEFLNEINSAGVVNVFNAFASKIIETNKESIKEKAKNVGFRNTMDNTAEAQKFLARYGARPVKANYPQVRSATYEMLLAYQQFCLAWSRQFLTPFEFTFMPELFPGGKVGFPDHGLQMFVESVHHSWDLTTGYTTEAQLCAPAIMEGEGANPGADQLPNDMVRALVRPSEKVTNPTIEEKEALKREEKALHISPKGQLY